ncbi:ankyrin repeat-containing domain protein, partial [Mycena galopus ATCC 62051]
MLLNEVVDLDAVSDYMPALGAALETASRKGHIDITRMLLEKVVSSNSLGGNEVHAALEAASREGHIDMVKMLLDKVADLDPVSLYGRRNYSNTLQASLKAASGRGHFDIAKMLLTKVVNLDSVKPSSGALRAAAIYGHTAIVVLLLESDFEINDSPPKSFSFRRKQGTISSSLEKAVESGHADIVRILLARQAKFDDRLVQIAVAGGFAEIVNALLKAGADPNVDVAFWEDTALETAVNAGNKYLVQMLLDHGA